MQHFPFPVLLKRSPRAQRVRLTVKASGVECVIPLRCSEQQAWSFVEQHRDWLSAKHKEAAARTSDRSFWDDLGDSRVSMLPIQGCNVPLQVTASEDIRPRLDADEFRFQLHLPAGDRSDWPVLGERVLFIWAQGWLAARAGGILQRHQGRARLHAGRVCIKRMRTRWGSCGAHDAINLNWLLTFAPAAVLEYVVVHELCHVRHRDHSTRFWTLVGEHLPGFREQRIWLKNHGQGLIHRFGTTHR